MSLPPALHVQENKDDPFDVFLTVNERDILSDRLSLTDCICEALEHLEYEKEKIERCAEKWSNKFEWSGLFPECKLTELDKEVLGDAIDGSTYVISIKQMLEAGEITKAQYAAKIRIMRSIEKKMAGFGIDVKFPMN